MPKPNCDNGTTCGDACISSKDRCRDTVDASAASALVKSARIIPKVEPFSVVKELGAGAFGKAQLTERGTVVKTLSTVGVEGEQLSRADYQTALLAEYNGLKVLARLGVGPTPVGMNLEALQLEMRAVDGSTIEQAYEGDEDVLDKAVHQLIVLHKAGYVHGDPHVGNAIVRPDSSVLFVDAAFVSKVGDSGARALDTGADDLYALLGDYHPTLETIEQHLFDSGATERNKQRRLVIRKTGDIALNKHLTTVATQEYHKDYLAALTATGY